MCIKCKAIHSSEYLLLVLALGSSHRKEGKCIAQALGIAWQQLGISWKWKKLLVYWANYIKPRKATAVDARNSVRAEKKNLKTSGNDITNNLHRAGVNIVQTTVWIRERQYIDYTTRCKSLISSTNWKARLQFARKYRDELWNKVLWTDDTKVNLYQCAGKCGDKRDLFMIQNIKAHLWAFMLYFMLCGGSFMAWACKAVMCILCYVEEVSWLGLARLLLEWTHWSLLMTQLMMVPAGWIHKSTKTFCLPTYREMCPN